MPPRMARMMVRLLPAIRANRHSVSLNAVRMAGGIDDLLG
jgi:hypothetical protein